MKVLCKATIYIMLPTGKKSRDQMTEINAMDIEDYRKGGFKINANLDIIRVVGENEDEDILKRREILDLSATATYPISFGGYTWYFNVKDGIFMRNQEIEI